MEVCSKRPRKIPQSGHRDYRLEIQADIPDIERPNCIEAWWAYLEPWLVQEIFVQFRMPTCLFGRSGVYTGGWQIRQTHWELFSTHVLRRHVQLNSNYSHTLSGLGFNEVC